MTWGLGVAVSSITARYRGFGRQEALDDKMKYLADFGSLHPVPEGTEGGAVDRHVT